MKQATVQVSDESDSVSNINNARVNRIIEIWFAELRSAPTCTRHTCTSLPQDIEILGWCSVEAVLLNREKVPLQP